MKNRLLKLAGGLAIAAIIGFSSITTSNAQEVSLDGISVQDVNVEAFARRPWHVLFGSDVIFITRGERAAASPTD